MRRLAQLALAAVLALLLTPPSAAAQGGDSAVLLGGADEVYIAGLPAGWTKQAEVSDSLGYRGDWLPAGQTMADWSDRMTLQVVPGMAAQPPQQFLEALVPLWSKSCEAVMASEMEFESVNGYTVGSRVLACTQDRQSGNGGVSLYRIVAGERALYVIQRAYRLAPFARDSFPLSAATLAEGRSAVAYGLACRRDGAGSPCPADWLPVLAQLGSGRQMVVFPGSQ